MEEMRRVLKRLQDTAVKAAADEKAQVKLVSELRKGAREAQQYATQQAKLATIQASSPSRRDSHE